MQNVHHHHYYEALRERKWRVALIISILFGMVGADRMYLGHIGLGVLKMFTLGGFGLWALIDIILVATRRINGVKWID